MPTDIGPTDTKHEDLRSLRIDRSLRDGGGEPPVWSRRFILGGIAVVALLGIVALAYRALASETAEVEVARATAESSDVAGSTVLSASGYIVAHHKISVNSKVTGRVAWIGVEKGDKVKEGQVLVRLEDQEFRAQYEQARGAVESAKARLLECFGPQLGRPHVDTLKDSKYTNMKELRFRASGGVWRVAFAFDPERDAILLVAGDKSGGSEKTFYRRLIEKADKRYKEHLEDM